MGQYHHIAILAENHESIHPMERAIVHIHPADYGDYEKLLEWAYLNGETTLALESLINDINGRYAGYPVVVIGDYGDNESFNGEEFEKSLYDIIMRSPENRTVKRLKKCPTVVHPYHYAINHTKKEYVCLDIKGEWVLHPLILLCAECNGRGNGDYFGRNVELVGTWARDCISVSKEKPDGYEEIVPNFGYMTDNI